MLCYNPVDVLAVVVATMQSGVWQHRDAVGQRVEIIAAVFTETFAICTVFYFVCFVRYFSIRLCNTSVVLCVEV